MARPVKNTVDYFPHYCHHGGTILILERKYGIQGSGAWWKLLENLGRTEGHSIDCNDKTKWLLLQADTYFSSEELTDYINLLADLNAIDAELWCKNKVIWCQNLVNKISNVYLDRRRDIPKKPNLNHNDKNVSTVDNLVSTVDNERQQDKQPLVTTVDNLVSTVDNERQQDKQPLVSTVDNLVSTVDNTQIKPNEIKPNNKEIYKEIFNIWNSQKIMTHKKLNELIIRAIDKALKNYTVGEIISAIVVYGSIVTNPKEYWFPYKWSLQEFLTGGKTIVKFQDEQIARDNFRIKQKTTTSSKPFSKTPQKLKTIEDVRTEMGDKW